MDMKTEAVLVCMIVSNPTGGERPQGWQKRVNDFIRAQRAALDAAADMAAAAENLIPVALHYGGLTDEHVDAIKRAETTIRDFRSVRTAPPQNRTSPKHES